MRNKPRTIVHFIFIPAAFSLGFGQCCYSAFDNVIQSGRAEYSPFVGSKVWDDYEGRYASNHDLVANLDGQLTTVASIEWDLGPVNDEQFLIQMFGTSVAANGTGIDGRMLFSDSISFQITKQTKFVLSGTLEEFSIGASRFIFSGAGMSLDGSASGTTSIDLKSDEVQSPVKLFGTLMPGHYTMLVAGHSNPLGGSYAIDLVLQIPAASTSCILLIGGVWSAGSNRNRRG